MIGDRTASISSFVSNNGAPRKSFEIVEIATDKLRTRARTISPFPLLFFSPFSLIFGLPPVQFSSTVLGLFAVLGLVLGTRTSSSNSKSDRSHERRYDRAFRSPASVRSRAYNPTLRVTRSRADTRDALPSDVHRNENARDDVRSFTKLVVAFSSSFRLVQPVRAVVTRIVFYRIQSLTNRSLSHSPQTRILCYNCGGSLVTRQKYRRSSFLRFPLARDPISNDLCAEEDSQLRVATLGSHDVGSIERIEFTSRYFIPFRSRERSVRENATSRRFRCFSLIFLQFFFNFSLIFLSRTESKKQERRETRRFDVELRRNGKKRNENGSIGRNFRC